MITLNEFLTNDINDIDVPDTANSKNFRFIFYKQSDGVSLIAKYDDLKPLKHELNRIETHRSNLWSEIDEIEKYDDLKASDYIHIRYFKGYQEWEVDSINKMIWRNINVYINAVNPIETRYFNNVNIGDFLNYAGI